MRVGIILIFPGSTISTKISQDKKLSLCGLQRLVLSCMARLQKIMDILKYFVLYSFKRINISCMIWYDAMMIIPINGIMHVIPYYHKNQHIFIKLSENRILKGALLDMWVVVHCISLVVKENMNTRFFSGWVPLTEDEAFYIRLSVWVTFISHLLPSS